MKTNKRKGRREGTGGRWEDKRRSDRGNQIVAKVIEGDGVKEEQKTRKMR